jgi:hypothetical protein
MKLLCQSGVTRKLKLHTYVSNKNKAEQNYSVNYVNKTMVLRLINEKKF